MKEKNMDTNNENIISGLLQFTIESISELIFILPSLKNSETAYDNFVSTKLRNLVNKYYDSKLRVHSVIVNNNSYPAIMSVEINPPNGTAVICGSRRLTKENKKAIVEEISILGHNWNLKKISSYFLIIYSETSDFEESWNSYQKSLTQSNYSIQQEVDNKANNEVKILKTIKSDSSKLIPVYHIFVDTNHKKQGDSDTTNENIIFHLTINAIKDLPQIVYSLKNTEFAYNDFIANNLKTYIASNIQKYIDEFDYEGMTIKQEYKVSNGSQLKIVDFVINTPSGILAAYEGFRIQNSNFNIINRKITQVKSQFSVGASIYFLVVYSETTNFEESWNHYQNALIQSNYVIEREIDVSKISKKIKAIKTSIFDNQKFTPIYHIFTDVGHSKEEIISLNRLQNISISKLKIFDEITIDLTPNINIILGKNAFGKTSFLQALTLANIPDNYRLPYQDFVRRNYAESEIVLHRENEQELIIQIDKGGKINGNLTENIHEPLFLAYGTNIFSKYTQHNYTALVDELLNGTEKWYNAESIFEEYSLTFYDPLGVLNTLNETPEEGAKNIKDFIFNSLNQLLPKDFRITPDSKYSKSYYFLDKSGVLLKTNQLSEGYKHNILLITDIILRVISIGTKMYDDLPSLFASIKGIIAIDEFDRHMHPSWQKSYIDNLSSFLPNIQFVLTTHNPVAILGRKEKEIQMFYYDENNHLSIKQLPETLSIDAGTVLLTHFDMDSILSTKLQQKVDTFYNLKVKEEDNSLSDGEKIELKKLRVELDDTFIGVNIHDFRFLKFLKFLKKNGFDHRERLEELVITDEDIANFRNEFKEYYQ